MYESVTLQGRALAPSLRSTFPSSDLESQCNIPTVPGAVSKCGSKPHWELYRKLAQITMNLWYSLVLFWISEPLFLTFCDCLQSHSKGARCAQPTVQFLGFWGILVETLLKGVWVCVPHGDLVNPSRYTRMSKELITGNEWLETSYSPHWGTFRSSL